MARDRRPAHHQWDQIANEAHALVDRITRDGPEVLRRAKQATRDGYPTQSMPVPGGKGGHGDPVFNVVASDALTDPVRDAARSLISHMLEALEHLRAADGARGRAFPPTEAEVRQLEELKAQVGCVNCHRYGFFSAVEKAGRCEADYRYRLRNGEDAPEHVVLGREQIRQRRIHEDEVAA